MIGSVRHVLPRREGAVRAVRAAGVGSDAGCGWCRFAWRQTGPGRTASRGASQFQGSGLGPGFAGVRPAVAFRLALSQGEPARQQPGDLGWGDRPREDMGGPELAGQRRRPLVRLGSNTRNSALGAACAARSRSSSPAGHGGRDRSARPGRPVPPAPLRGRPSSGSRPSGSTRQASEAGGAGPRSPVVRGSPPPNSPTPNRLSPPDPNRPSSVPIFVPERIVIITVWLPLRRGPSRHCLIPCINPSGSDGSRGRSPGNGA